METSLFVAFFAFCRNIVGLVTRPYETVRRIVDRSQMAELLYVAILLVFYFSLASVVKIATFRPFLLTREFMVLATGAAMTYMVAVGVFWFAGKLVGATGSLKGLALSWGYSLVPTFLWFLGTSLLYVLVPPPRTTSPQGIIFSILFLVFSATLFFWKITLAYLSLRFSLKLGLGKILIVAAVTLPVFALYSVGMYRWGIFRVPFL